MWALEEVEERGLAYTGDRMMRQWMPLHTLPRAWSGGQGGLVRMETIQRQNGWGEGSESPEWTLP
jgi:hypothetical protein